MFIDTLNSMLNTLSKYKRNKYDLIELYINERLEKSLKTYYLELYNSLDYLLSKNDLRVLKNVDKVEK